MAKNFLIVLISLVQISCLPQFTKSESTAESLTQEQQDTLVTARNDLNSGGLDAAAEAYEQILSQTTPPSPARAEALYGMILVRLSDGASLKNQKQVDDLMDELTDQYPDFHRRAELQRIRVLLDQMLQKEKRLLTERAKARAFKKKNKTLTREIEKKDEALRQVRESLINP